MTARIQREFEFVSGVYIENELYLNVYNLSIFFTVETESIYEQNIALDRIKYFFVEKLENCIFLNQSDTQNIENLSELKIVCLPEDPYDQIIGIMLIEKINSITEGRLCVTDIEITSRMSDGVSYLHSVEESVGPFATKGWWNDSSPNVGGKISKSKTKKVVKLKRTPNSWEELNLGWKETKKSEIVNDVLFVSFEAKTDK